MLITLSTILEITVDCYFEETQAPAMLRWMNLKGTPLYSINMLYGVTYCKISIPLQPTPLYQLEVLQCSCRAKNVFRESQFHCSFSVLCFYMQICISGQKRLFIYCHHRSSPESIIYFCLWPSVLLAAVLSASPSWTFYSPAASEYK